MRGAIAEKDNIMTSADRRYHLGHADVWAWGKRLSTWRALGITYTDFHLSLAEKIASEDSSGLREGYERFLEALIVRDIIPVPQSRFL
jgi:hypothetical protein